MAVLDRRLGVVTVANLVAWPLMRHRQCSARPGRGGQSKLPAGSPALEEIVVTAQKREERLQDVPVAISAVSGEDARSQPRHRPVHARGERAVGQHDAGLGRVAATQHPRRRQRQAQRRLGRAVGRPVRRRGLHAAHGLGVHGLLRPRPHRGHPRPAGRAARQERRRRRVERHHREAELHDQRRRPQSRTAITTASWRTAT